MKYNKNEFVKTNDHKIMHKVKKQWVVISLAALMLIGGGVAMTNVSANAANNESNSPKAVDNVSNNKQSSSSSQTNGETTTYSNPQSKNNVKLANKLNGAPIQIAQVGNNTKTTILFNKNFNPYNFNTNDNYIYETDNNGNKQRIKYAEFEFFL